MQIHKNIILEKNQSLKVTLALYTDFECLLIKDQARLNNSEKPVLREKLGTNPQAIH